jgi:hypothetical protein
MRRPTIRSLVGGAAGIAAGVTTGVVLTAVSAAGPPAVPSSPALIDAAHVPPLLRLPGEPVRLRYSIVCAPRDDGRPCEGSGTVYVRPGGDGAFSPLPLRRGDESKDGRYYVDVPPELTASPAGLSYYAVLRDDSSGATMTVPSGGADAPQASLPLRDAVSVELGRHEFGRVRPPDARAAEAVWGSAPQDVGLAGTRALGYSGPSSFDVEPDGTVDLLDSVNGRIIRWRHGKPESVALGDETELSDLVVEANGSFDVLEPPGMLRRFGSDGAPKWSQKLADRTWAKLARGPSGPVVLQQPSEQWLPVAEQGAPLTRSAQAQAAHEGEPMPNGHELVVDRVGDGELRVAETRGRSRILRAWRITSSTPLGEVQLAEPDGGGVVVVTKTYTDDRDEFLVLILDHSGLAESFSVAADSWTETAPLARFRLTPAGLYRLRTTESGASVDRFDLEVPR